jgi:hypothetical protein
MSIARARYIRRSYVVSALKKRSCALIAYLYLNESHRADSSLFPGCTNRLQILERAIIDTKLRSTVEEHTRRFSICSEPIYPLRALSRTHAARPAFHLIRSVIQVFLVRLLRRTHYRILHGVMVLAPLKPGPFGPS